MRLFRIDVVWYDNKNVGHTDQFYVFAEAASAACAQALKERVVYTSTEARVKSCYEV